MKLPSFCGGYQNIVLCLTQPIWYHADKARKRQRAVVVSGCLHHSTVEAFSRMWGEFIENQEGTSESCGRLIRCRSDMCHFNTLVSLLAVRTCSVRLFCPSTSSYDTDAPLSYSFKTSRRDGVGGDEISAREDFTTGIHPRLMIFWRKKYSIENTADLTLGDWSFLDILDESLNLRINYFDN